MRSLFFVAALAALGLGCAKPCDLNDDGRVDRLDAVEFQEAFGSSKGDPNYDKDLDFDNDGSILGNDFSAYLAECGEE